MFKNVHESPLETSLSEIYFKEYIILLLNEYAIA